MNWKKLCGLLAIVGLLTSTGVYGYMHIEGWAFRDALYMTVITLTTTGYQEVQPLSRDGQLFTMVFLIAGFASFAYIITSIVKQVVELEFNQIFWRKSMKKKIEQLKDHTIVCGFGKMGKSIAEELHKAGQEFVILEGNIDRDDELFELGYLHIVGNASSDDALIAAGIERAKHLVTVVSTDSENVFISLSARTLNKDINIIARANEESAEEKLRRAGANKTVSPYHITSYKITQAVINPEMEDFLQVMSDDKTVDFKMADMITTEESSFINQNLIEADFKEKGVIVVGIQKADGSMIYAPKADIRIELGDRVITLGSGKGIDTLLNSEPKSELKVVG